MPPLSTYADFSCSAEDSAASSHLLLAAFGCHQRYEKVLASKSLFLVGFTSSFAGLPKQSNDLLWYLLLVVLLIVFIVGGVFLQFQFDSYCGWSMIALLRKFSPIHRALSKAADNQEQNFWVSWHRQKRRKTKVYIYKKKIKEMKTQNGRKLVPMAEFQIYCHFFTFLILYYYLFLLLWPF